MAASDYSGAAFSKGFFDDHFTIKLDVTFRSAGNFDEAGS